MDASEKYTIDDILNSDERLEMINGMIVVENYTSPMHNRCVRWISGALDGFISSHDGSCEVFTENVGLFVSELSNNANNFFMPDVMVVCDTDGIKEDGVHSVPLFVAEVTSESTKINDYNIKREIYRDIGVAEYWVVDLQRKTVFKYLSEEGYIPQAFMHPETVEVSVYPGLEIDLNEFMK